MENNRTAGQTADRAKKPPLVVTFTLNPCVDRTICVPGVKYGGTNHITEARQDVAGKGINVSIALRQLGVDTVCLGFSYSGGASLVERDLDERGIAHDFVEVDGDLRMNIKVFDESRRVMTEFNERGGEVSPEAVERLLEKTRRYLDRAAIAVLTGSVPRGVPDDIYARIIRMAHEKEVLTVLDASGALFREGLKAKPFLIKPNRDEFTEAFGEELAAGKSIAEVARGVVEQGVGHVCVSMGAEGALLACAQGIFTADAPDVEVRGIQGAGDSLVAGMCAALAQEISIGWPSCRPGAAQSGTGTGTERMHPADRETDMEPVQPTVPKADTGFACPDRPETDEGSACPVAAEAGRVLRRDISGEKLLHCAVTAAGGSLMRPGTQMCTREDFLALYEKVTVREA